MNMKYGFLLLSLAALLFFACTPGGNHTYDKNGISFDYPGNWKIREETIEPDGTSIGLLRQNVDGTSFGHMFIAIAKAADEPRLIEELLESVLKGIENEQSVRYHKAEPPVPDSCCGMAGLSRDFTFSTETNGVVGTVRAFENDRWTVVLMEQGPYDDRLKNQPDFELIRSALTLK